MNSDSSNVGQQPTTAIKPQSKYKGIFRRIKSWMSSELNEENSVRQAVANMPPRRIYLNKPVPKENLPVHAHRFCTNAIVTSQYTLLNFLPKNLSRQFCRVANLYFLVLTILQMITYFAVGSKFLAVVPLILVLSITAIKDAYEDWQRHKSDNRFNETPTRIVRNLRNANLLWQDQQADRAREHRLLRWRIELARRMKRKTWYNQVPHNWEESLNPVDLATPPALNESAKWKNVRVGDFVILKTGDPAPADVLMLAASSDDGGCYVETKNLDGETNLKPRSSLVETAGVRDAEGCSRLEAIVEVDPPSSNMGKLNGSITITSVPSAPIGLGTNNSSSGNSTPGFFMPQGPTTASHFDSLRQSLSPSSPLQSSTTPLSAPAASISSQQQKKYPFGTLKSPLGSDSYEMRVLNQQVKHQSPLAASAASKTMVSSSAHYRADNNDATEEQAGQNIAPTPSSAAAFDQKIMAAISGNGNGNSDNEDVLGKSLPDNDDYSENPILVPFSLSNVLLRGMTVRNTDWVVGLVLYTGDQTKMLLNAGPTPFKRSRIERMMNMQVILSFNYVFVTSFIVALVGGLRYDKPEYRSALYVDNTMSEGLYGFALFWSAMIMLQNVIPIALYVSIEFVKSWHAYWIYQDIHMYYEPTDQRCIARNWNISDDLGQVSYIFSDKTGTLTRNVMDFRMCSINGTIYGKQLPGDELDVVKGRMAQEEVDRNNPPEGGTNPFFMELQEEEEHEDDDEYLRPPRTSGNTSMASMGTSQYDSSPLISSTDSPRFQDHRSKRAPSQQLQQKKHRLTPAPISVGAARTRTRTIQAMTDEEVSVKRKQMIGTYLGAMRKVFEPQYVEIGNEETGEEGSYTFVDPQLFYDMKPEVAPPNKISGNITAVPNDITNIGVSVRRMASHRSISTGFDVNADRQKGVIDLFMTELATCHAVVVEKSFQKHIVHDDGDDQSTLRRITRMFHNRSGSKKLSSIARHVRTRSKIHARTDSVATSSSAGGGNDETDGVEWVRSDSHPSISGESGNRRRRKTSTSIVSMDTNSAPLSAEQPSQPPQPSSGVQSSRREQPSSSESPETGRSDPQPSSKPSYDMSKLAYSSESPDEGALVRAAKNFGYTFLGRVKSTIYLDIRGEKTQYEVLDTIEFNSTRKRMSVILKRPAPHNDIILFCKGADNVMIERLGKLPNRNEDPYPYSGHDEVGFERIMRERTFGQIDEFANAGLRTLMLCYRNLTESEWVRWSARYHAAQGSVADDRDEQIDKITEEMECELRMVGATAIEDKLQEKVPDAIASLRAAGMRIWVLTGDKMETAINIGFAANLLTKEMELWTITNAAGREKILSRFRLIARIMRQTSESSRDASNQARHSSAGKGSRVGLGPEDAQALGSVSYKISRARKFLRFGKHSRHHGNANVNANVNTSSNGNTTVTSSADESVGGEPTKASMHRSKPTSAGDADGIAPRSPFPQLAGEDEMSPDEVRQSIDYLQRQSSITEDGGLSEGINRDSYHPLNALVIDGAALSIVMGDPACRALLLEIAPLFKSVVCCRASPLQKAEVVKLVKDGLHLVTLAIGDGANDVSMIQTADIGVAISGEEGLQASMASDYTFGRFHFLQNLLLVHGLFDYLRMSEMILSFFYKNIIWAMVPFWYSIYCSFSANVFYDLSYIQLYNVVFTVAPVAILGCVDKPFNYRTAMTYVAVYADGINNRYFKWWRYYLYIVDGIYQSAAIFFTFYLFTYWSDVQSANGRTWGRSDISTGPTVAVVVAASLCIGLNSWQWNWIMLASIVFSIAACILYIAVASFVRYYSLEGIATAVMSTVQFWFGVPIAVVVALLPRYCVRAWQKMNRPRDLDIIREIKVLHRPWYGQVFVEPSDLPLPVDKKGKAKEKRF